MKATQPRPSRRRTTSLGLALLAVALSALTGGVVAPAGAASTIAVDCAADPTALVVAFANANPGDTLAIEGTCTGALDIAKDITLAGSGAATIDGQGLAIRVLTVRAGATVSITGLTIVGGNGFAGVGIHNLGTVTMTNSTVSGNVATLWGGGIYNRYGATLKLVNSAVAGNSAGENGGGIYNDGTLTLSNSTVSGNNGGLGGGGVLNSSFGTFNLTSGHVSGNTAQFGGGVSNNGLLEVASATISSNRASYGGGLYLGGGRAIIEGATIADNSAIVDGGGVDHGGGQYSYWMPPVVRNTTIFGNSAGGSGGGLANTGYIGSIALEHVTIAGNRASLSGAGIANTGYSGQVTLRSTIIAAPADGQNCDGPILDGGYNLDDGASCGLTAADNSQPNTNPLLDPAGLRYNGGPTQTVALEPESPGVDAIPNGTNGCGTSLTIDQRGISRPQGSACDIGAYELEAAVLQVTGHGRFNTDGNGQVTFTLSNEALSFERIRGQRFTFAGEVESVTGSENTATLAGIGSWKGGSGYAFEVSVVDNANWGRLEDTIEVVIRDPSGAVVFTSFGPQVLKQGDITVTRADSG